MSRFASNILPTEILSLRLFSQRSREEKVTLHLHLPACLTLPNLTPAGIVTTGTRAWGAPWCRPWWFVLELGFGLRDRGLVSWYIMITHQLPSHLASFGNIHLGYQRGWRYMMSALEVTVAKDQVDATWKQIWRWGCDIRNTWHEMVVFVMSCFSLDTVHQLVLKNFEIDLRKRYSLGLPWFASMSCMLRVQRKASARIKKALRLELQVLRCGCVKIGCTPRYGLFKS